MIGLLASAMLMQAPVPLKHDCHVYAVNREESEKLMETLATRPNWKPEEIKKLAEKSEMRLGEFKAEVGEEFATTKSYPLPLTDLTVTVTVFYTDEMMDLSGYSMLQGLVIRKGAVENALAEPGASVTEVNLEKSTYKVRTKQQVAIRGKLWLIGLECQCVSTEERKKQVLGK